MRRFLVLCVGFVVAAFAVKSAWAHCAGRKPLTDAQVEAGYRFVQEELRESPAKLERDYQKVRHEFASEGAFVRYLHHYLSKPESTYVNTMRDYRRWYYGGHCSSGGGESQGAPRPNCESNHECNGGYQCINGNCEEIGSTAGDCHYGSCAVGFNCQTSGLCE